MAEVSSGLLTSGTILFGVDEAPPAPLNFGLPGSPDFRGFEVDLMHAAARRLGLIPRFRSALWSTILAELTAGRLDVICGAATVTAERARTVQFSRPYLAITLALVARAGSGITNLSQLAGRQVGARAATEAEKLVRGRVPTASIRTFDLNTGQYAALASGEVDALVDDAPIAGYFSTVTPGVTLVGALPDTDSHYAFAVARGNDTLRRALDGVLDELESDGTLGRLGHQWLRVPGAPPPAPA